MEKRSGSRALNFCLLVAISAVLLLRLGHCHALQPQHRVFDEHKVNTMILGDVLEGCGVINYNTGRRKILRHVFGSAVAFGIVGSSPPLSFASTSYSPNNSIVRHPFAYSDSWTGTRLNIKSLEESTNSGAYTTDVSGLSYWAMGKWPDPALRIPAKPVDPSMLLDAVKQQRLELAATILRDTANREGAVGLAAQQCGVDARMVFLSASGVGNSDMVLINPRIVARSPESSMKVWTEECLVLPPTFRATVLRDDWIDVEYDFCYEYRSKKSIISSAGSQTPIKQRFFKEQSRCLQHELDHDRGILITDHVGLDELENDVMRKIEAEDHEKRQALAYSRQ